MTFRLDRFDDFHLHGASAPEWNQRYLQMSPGAMRSSLAEVTAGGVHVFRKWMSERVVQQGCLPAGKICFAVPVGSACGTPRIQGRELREDSVFILRSGEEFTLQRPGGMELLAVTFEAEDFRRLLDARPWTANARALLSRPVLLAPRDSLQRLRRDLLALFTHDLPASHVVFEALGDLFNNAADSHQGFGSASASYIVAECHRAVAARADAPPSIDELCVQLRTSRSSVQNSFRQVADTTAVHYLRSVRLNAARRQLMSTRPADLSIAQAAADQGFDHMSHFAQRYQSLFGELPSRTLRKISPASPRP
ncbi:MAG: AraC-type DNA-binding protein [Ramlibacter sp.]|nr:AraC-type DNA-binding protein [Ramlibacter sp.]